MQPTPNSLVGSCDLLEPLRGSLHAVRMLVRVALQRQAAVMPFDFILRRPLRQTQGLEVRVQLGKGAALGRLQARLCLVTPSRSLASTHSDTLQASSVNKGDLIPVREACIT